jgi:hypothetical protein
MAGLNTEFCVEIGLSSFLYSSSELDPSTFKSALHELVLSLLSIFFLLSFLPFPSLFSHTHIIYTGKFCVELGVSSFLDSSSELDPSTFKFALQVCGKLCCLDKASWCWTGSLSRVIVLSENELVLSLFVYFFSFSCHSCSLHSHTQIYLYRAVTMNSAFSLVCPHFLIL